MDTIRRIAASATGSVSFDATGKLVEFADPVSKAVTGFGSGYFKNPEDFADYVFREYGILKIQKKLERANIGNNTTIAALIKSHFDVYKNGIKSSFSMFQNSLQTYISSGDPIQRALEKALTNIEGYVNSAKAKAELEHPLSGLESKLSHAHVSI